MVNQSSLGGLFQPMALPEASALAIPGSLTGNQWGIAIPGSLPNVNVNVNILLAISIQDFDNSEEPGPQAKGVNHLETLLRQLHVTHRASSCAKRSGHAQLCSKPKGARGIEPEPFKRRGQLLSCRPTTGPTCVRQSMCYNRVNGQRHVNFLLVT